jgi:hypothetical protein
MAGMAIKGEAKDDKQVFEFFIEPCALGGFLLSIRYSPRYVLAALGVWPSVEKAKEIAQANATKLLHGAEIKWLG